MFRAINATLVILIEQVEDVINTAIQRTTNSYSALELVELLGLLQVLQAVKPGHVSQLCVIAFI